MPQIARFTARRAALQILLRAGHRLRFTPCPAHAKAHTPRHPTAVSRLKRLDVKTSAFFSHKLYMQHLHGQHERHDPFQLHQMIIRLHVRRK